MFFHQMSIQPADLVSNKNDILYEKGHTIRSNTGITATCVLCNTLSLASGSECMTSTLTARLLQIHAKWHNIPTNSSIITNRLEINVWEIYVE